MQDGDHVSVTRDLEERAIENGVKRRPADQVGPPSVPLKGIYKIIGCITRAQVAILPHSPNYLELQQEDAGVGKCCALRRAPEQIADAVPAQGAFTLIRRSRIELRDGSHESAPRHSHSQRPL